MLTEVPKAPEASTESIWEKISTVYKKVGREGVVLALTLYYLVTDSEVSLVVKASAIAALSYFVLPLDLIPDVLIGVGYTDDIAAMAATVKMAITSIVPHHTELAEQKASEWFNSPNNNTKEITVESNNQD